MQQYQYRFRRHIHIVALYTEEDYFRYTAGINRGWPITVAEARTVFALSIAGIMGLNLTQRMNVCICVYILFVLFCT
jgi:hypothetical protein